LFSSEDGSFAKVQFLVSNAGLEGHGKAAVRAIVVAPDGRATEDSDTFQSGEWGVQPEGAIEMGASRLTMGPDASHHVHFAGRRLEAAAAGLALNLEGRQDRGALDHREDRLRESAPRAGRSLRVRRAAAGDRDRRRIAGRNGDGPDRGEKAALPPGRARRDGA